MNLKGKGRAGKQVHRRQPKNKGADKRARICDTDIEIESKGSESDDRDSESEEEESGDKVETKKVCFIFFGSLRLLTRLARP